MLMLRSISQHSRGAKILSSAFLHVIMGSPFQKVKFFIHSGSNDWLYGSSQKRKSFKLLLSDQNNFIQCSHLSSKLMEMVGDQSLSFSRSFNVVCYKKNRFTSQENELVFVQFALTTVLLINEHKNFKGFPRLSTTDAGMGCSRQAVTRKIKSSMYFIRVFYA